MSIKNVVLSTAEELQKLGCTDFEFILVNDCSPDNCRTTQVLSSMADEYSYVKVIELSKNVGQHNAIMAGLNNCCGDVIIGMDDDGQTHPSQIKILLEKFNEDYDLVYGYYPEKKHSFLRNIFSYLNHLSVRILINKPKDLKNSSFWIARRFVIDEVTRYKGCYSHLQGLFIRTTSNIACVPIQHFEREYGESGYTFKALLRLWSSVIGFSVVPLRLSAYLGYLSAFIGLLGGVIIFIRKLLNPNMAIGWPSTMVVLFVFSGIILLFMGILGEYIGRMYISQNSQPQYTIKSKKNFDN